jgi:hypothetical protein
VGLRDILAGRTKQVQPKLDNLFALSEAAITLETSLDLVTSGQAGLLFKAGSGSDTITADADILSLLNFDLAAEDVVLSTDAMGFKWLVVKDPDLSSLVTRIHGANTALVENGLGARLLCAVFGFVDKTPPGEGDVRMIYLLKQGTWYPFAPTGKENRNNELELRVKAFLETELPMEKDLGRWMALWDLPVN